MGGPGFDSRCLQSTFRDTTNPCAKKLTHIFCIILVIFFVFRLFCNFSLWICQNFWMIHLREYTLLSFSKKLGCLVFLKQSPYVMKRTSSDKGIQWWIGRRYFFKSYFSLLSKIFLLPLVKNELIMSVKYLSDRLISHIYRLNSKTQSVAFTII